MKDDPIAIFRAIRLYTVQEVRQKFSTCDKVIKVNERSGFPIEVTHVTSIFVALFLSTMTTCAIHYVNAGFHFTVNCPFFAVDFYNLSFTIF